MRTQKAIFSLLALLSAGMFLMWSVAAPPCVPKTASTAKRAPHPTPTGMAWIPSGTFLMGSIDGKPDELPVHSVELEGFWMDETEVTNAEFQRFVEATGYVTIAERTPKREDFVGLTADVSVIAEEDLVPSSICFNPDFDRALLRKVRANPENVNWPYLVWAISKGANWRHPNGPDSTIEDKMNHPVVHVAWADAVAYCEWTGKRLPTEAEFEYAARGGREQQKYPWGDELKIENSWVSNLWQGEFPEEHTVADGFEFTAPVKSFAPNGYGLFDIAGNVWEWCADWYRPDYYAFSLRRNPTGPPDSFDPNEPKMPKRVQRGGSFMCNANYCLGYRCAARMKGEPTSSLFHSGFRCVLSPAKYEEFKKAPAQTTNRSS